MAKFGVKQSDFSRGLTITGSLLVSGSQTITGSITSTNGFTGSLLGTASQAVSSSFAATASLAPNYTLTSTFVSASASFDNRITSTSGSLAILSSSYRQDSASFDDRITDNSSSISILSGSFENLSSSFVDLNLTQIASGSYTASVGSYGFLVNTSASISGSLNVRDTITATTLVVQIITSSQELVTGSLIVSGSLNAYGGVTGSLQGTSSWAISSSYALVATSASYASASTSASYAQQATTSSYTLTASYVNPLTQSVYISGSLDLTSNTGNGFVSNADTLLFVGTASFSGLTSITSSLIIENQTNPASLFLIKSGSTQYFNVASSGDTTVNSNLFIIKNFTTQAPVLTVSQSIVSFATQSSDPTGAANNGAFWFTSTNLYVGLD
jgi:hypothetical protein